MIVVEVVEPTTAGRLWPRYDSESGILVAETTVKRPWPWGLTVDGCVIIDVDGERLLAAVDVHAPRRHWKHDVGLTWPSVAPPGDLRVHEESVRAKDFDDRVWVRRDAEAQCVLVAIGDADPVRHVSLSTHCVARLGRGDTLVGFVIRLGEATARVGSVRP